MTYLFHKLIYNIIKLKYHNKMILVGIIFLNQIIST